MNITLVYASAPRTVHEASLELAGPTTVEQVLDQAGWLQRFPEWEACSLGIWGRKAETTTLVRDGDRVELYRALRVDPKVARRERFVGQGARATGLFNRRRPGSKAGY